jgi:DNA-binding response OmpR family regulator
VVRARERIVAQSSHDANLPVTWMPHRIGMPVSTARILAVDDEPALTALLEYHLKRAGHNVCTAVNGWEAIEQIQHQRPDIILLDLMLPDLDGFGVCEILRRDPATATIPIIIISAWASLDSRNLGLELGALDYITKPFSPHQLVERVNRLLSLRNPAGPALGGAA